MEPETNNSELNSVIDRLSSLDNEEVAHIAERYVTDKEHTDLQQLLLDPKSRESVVDELAKIAKSADWSLADSLLDSANGTIEGLDKIRGDQETVDGLSDILQRAGSPLFTETKYPLPTDADYWAIESGFIDSRKSSDDDRWRATDDVESIESLRAEAEMLMSRVGGLLETATSIAGVQDRLVGISQRVKGAKSLIDKVAKMRGTDWGKDATAADVVDLIGGRIVVQDLTSLESVMLTLENMGDSGELAVLRKENKFIANDGQPNPYRAIHYVIQIPGTAHSVEIQLKTLSSMVASDLYHNVIYKPYILNLPSELSQSVVDYNWHSVEEEMQGYAAAKGVDTRQERSENNDSDIEIQNAIQNLDYNNFYDLVFARIDPDQPLPPETKRLIQEFHERETAKLMRLMETNPNVVMRLAAAAHNEYYQKAVADMVSDPTKPQLGAEINPDALAMLTESARELYASRFREFIAGRSSNKLDALSLGLDQLSEDDVKEFFRLSSKDAESNGKLAQFLDLLAQHRAGEDKTAELRKVALVNLYHAPFNELLDSATDESGTKYQEGSSEYNDWHEILLATQIKAISTASLLTEIGGTDAKGEFRDISSPIFPDEPYTVREFLTFASFISADRTDSEFAESSYRDFVTSPDSEWARDFDKAMDMAIMIETTTQQFQSIAEMMDAATTAAQMIRLQKARYEMLIKILSARGKNDEANAIRVLMNKEIIQLYRDSKNQDYTPYIDADFLDRRFEQIKKDFLETREMGGTAIKNFGK